jgi:serine/threonine-protein kinase
MAMWKACAQPVAHASETVTVVEPPQRARTPVLETSPNGDRLRIGGTQTEVRVATQIALRRALAVGCAVWVAFVGLDFAVVRYLHAGSLVHFLVWRGAVLVVTTLVLVRLNRRPTPSEWVLRAADLLVYTSCAVAIARMCVEFRGLASPYVPGFCLVLFSRTVTAPDPWRRGAVMTAVPGLSFFVVLLGSAFFSPLIAEQLRDSAALTTLLLNVGYVVGTCALLVGGNHIVWSLRQQVFEARNLGRYRLKRRLAAGGMGDVWLAYHPGLKRDVAVKILRPDERERSAMALARFEREVRSTAELMHPNTVRVFDYGMTEDGLWYYVMELLEGETLGDHVARLGPLPPARAVHIIGQAARALGEAHEHGIVHRDVKPENLFLTSLGGEHDFVKVIDFGIAKVQTYDGKVTDTGSLLGTPAYMAPEMAMGLSADPRSDVYALGAVLYFLLCGKPPFEADNAGALIFAHVNQAVIPPSQNLGRALPGDVEAVALRALAKDPNDRYGTAAELALALSTCTLAGKWTFGDATTVAKRSSRPPPAGGGLVEVIPSLRAPRVPHIEPVDASGGRDAPSGTTAIGDVRGVVASR